MKLMTKIFKAIFDKDCLLSVLIDTPFWIAFFIGGWCLVFLFTMAIVYKVVILIGLAAVLYSLCVMTNKIIFKKLGRKPPE